MKKNKKLIPKGSYCYSVPNGKSFEHRVLCPYWREDLSKEEQERGYCEYIGKGDWDVNKEKNWTGPIGKDGIPNQDKLVSAEELGLKLSLLWDQCKECDINK